MGARAASDLDKLWPVSSSCGDIPFYKILCWSKLFKEFDGDFSARFMKGTSKGFVLFGLKTLETNSKLAHNSKNFKA